MTYTVYINKRDYPFDDYETAYEFALCWLGILKQGDEIIEDFTGLPF